MPKAFKVGDTTYNFPDSMSDKEAQSVLTEQGIIKDESNMGKFMQGTRDWDAKHPAPGGGSAKEVLGGPVLPQGQVIPAAVGLLTEQGGRKLGLPEWANITAGLLAGGAVGAGQGFAKKLLGMSNEQRIEVLKQGMKLATKSKLGMFKDALNWITKHGKEAESETPKEVRFKDFQQGKGEYGQTFPKPKPAPEPPEPKAPEPFKPSQVTKRNMRDYPGPENKYQSPSYPKAGTGKPATPNGGVPLEKPPLGPPGGKFTPSSRTASLLNRAKGSVGESERAYGGPSYRAARSAMPKPGQVAKAAEEAGEAAPKATSSGQEESHYSKLASEMEANAKAKDAHVTQALKDAGIDKKKFETLSWAKRNEAIKETLKGTKWARNHRDYVAGSDKGKFRMDQITKGL